MAQRNWLRLRLPRWPTRSPVPLLPAFPCLICCSDFGESVKRVAKQVQASLPIVGLLSRLAAPAGGVGNEMQVPLFFLI